MSALQLWAGEVEDLFGISCRFECETAVLIHDDTMATHLYHIAQEAVNNAIKHGHATNILIRLSAENGWGTLPDQRRRHRHPGRPALQPRNGIAHYELSSGNDRRKVGRPSRIRRAERASPACSPWSPPAGREIPNDDKSSFLKDRCKPAKRPSSLSTTIP